ncbi:hypothetical protein OC861_003137 [Tilletia horrida]|nr:hypothetical protein OC861_003137 [Tilletia horrida]
MLNKRGEPDEQIDPEQAVHSLTPAQWAGLSRMFYLWPFKPNVMLESGRPTGTSTEEHHLGL